MIVHTILFVADQERSMSFYRALLDINPVLHVNGMTEFELSEGHILGLMPEEGIKRILGEKIPDPSQGNGTPRVELYIRVKDPEAYFERAKALNAIELSEIMDRSWGGRAGYVMDPDGHVIALAT